MNDCELLENCVGCTRKAALFQHLTEVELKEINANRHVASYDAGEIIFKQGTACTHMISFAVGLAKIYIEGEKELILRIVKPTEFVSGVGFFVNDRHHFSIKALVPSKACFIEAGLIRSLIRKNPRFGHAFMSEMSQIIILAFDRLTAMNQKHREGRMADALVYLYEKIYQDTSFVLDLTREDIANLAGISKETAFRLMKGFADDGIIRNDGRKIEILKPELLQEISIRG